MPSSDSSGGATMGEVLTKKDIEIAGQAFANLFQGKIFSFGANMVNLAAKRGDWDRVLDKTAIDSATLGVAQQSGKSVGAVASALTTLTSGPAALSLLGYIGALGWVVDKSSAFAKACTEVQSVATELTLGTVIQEFVKEILVQATKAFLPVVVGRVGGIGTKHAFTVAAALSDLAGALVPNAKPLSYSDIVQMIWKAAINPQTYQRCKVAMMQGTGAYFQETYGSNTEPVVKRSMGNTEPLVKLAFEIFPDDGAGRLLFAAVALGLIPIPSD